MEERKQRFAVVVFPGSNCDHDAYFAVKKVLGGDASFVWHREEDLDGYDCVILPGGFSYGDYLRSGAVARLSPIMRAVEAFAAAGGLVIGICNGFQILLEAGLLPGAMLRNRSLEFICRDVGVRVESVETPFSCECRVGDVLRIPIAHNEGNYYIDREGFQRLEANGQIVFRYAGLESNQWDEDNPNGSLGEVAGICNEGRNVLGMMPHPERCCEPAFSGGDGARIFTSIISWLERNGSSPTSHHHSAGSGS